MILSYFVPGACSASRRSGAYSNQKIGVMGGHRNSPLSISFNNFNISFCFESFFFSKNRFHCLFQLSVSVCSHFDNRGVLMRSSQLALAIGCRRRRYLSQLLNPATHRRVGIRSTNSSTDGQCQEMPKRWPSSRARSSGMQYIIEAGSNSAPFSTGILGAGMRWTPETFSCRRMFANRLLANR
jgi:hypothetical protein